MRIGVVGGDLLTFSRIESAARRAGVETVLLTRPGDAPDGLSLLLVDWSARSTAWSSELRAIRGRRTSPRVVVFGPHRDVEAHRDARAEGVGPMLARSKVFADLPDMIAQVRGVGSGEG